MNSPSLENVENLEINENKTEEELWLEEKQNCGFCRMFLASPCREQVSPLRISETDGSHENESFSSLVGQSVPIKQN